MPTTNTLPRSSETVRRVELYKYQTKNWAKRRQSAKFKFYLTSLQPDSDIERKCCEGTTGLHTILVLEGGIDLSDSVWIKRPWS